MTLCEYSGGIPTNMNLNAAKDVKIGLTTTIHGLGLIKGTAALDMGK